jgi:hypothetical protein
VAFAIASGALVVLTSGVQANEDNSKSHSGAAAAPAAAPTTSGGSTGCDVPGQACDPSKTDHDNGIGNNCDPGYGRGNQAKFPPDETTTGCRTKPAAETGQVENQNTTVQTEQKSESPSPGGGPGATTAAPAATTVAPANTNGAGGGAVLGETQTAPSGGVAGETASRGNAAQGGVLAATGLPILGALVGLGLLMFGGIAYLRRRL